MMCHVVVRVQFKFCAILYVRHVRHRIALGVNRHLVPAHRNMTLACKIDEDHDVLSPFSDFNLRCYAVPVARGCNVFEFGDLFR